MSCDISGHTSYNLVAHHSTMAASSGSSSPSMAALSILPAPSMALARSLLTVPGMSVEDILSPSTSAFNLYTKQISFTSSTEAAVDAMKRTTVVAISMGKQGTIQELIPYLTSYALQQQQQQQAVAAPSTASPAVAAASTATGNGSPPADEILLLLGQELIKICDFLGTTGVSASSTGGTVVDLLPLLERLAGIEETVVREQAVQVFVHLSDLLLKAAGQPTSKDGLVTGSTTTASTTTITSLDASAWVQVVKRLSAADWFTAKVSAAGILPAVTRLVLCQQVLADPMSAQQPNAVVLDLLSLYVELCQDETPMVRRSAAQYWGKMAHAAGWFYLREDDTATPVVVVPSGGSSTGSSGAGATPLPSIETPVAANNILQAALTKLCFDEQDSVRLLAVASLADVGIVFQQHPAWTVQHWLPLVHEGSTDLSWYVLCETFQGTVLNCLLNLSFLDRRVRHNLAKQFSKVVTNLGIQHNTKYQSEQSIVMACFVALLTDQEAEVRASAVTHLSPMVSWGGPAHFTSQLQPLLPALADDVVMEVRSKSALAFMQAASGGALPDTLVIQAFGPLLENFLQDEFHEVQLQVLTHLHEVSHLLPSLSGVVTNLVQMSKAGNWRVREAVAKLLPHLAEARGLDFFKTVLLDAVWMVLLLDAVSSVRRSIVQGMGLLVKVAGEEWMTRNLYPQHQAIFENSESSYLLRITMLQGYVEMAVACPGAATGSEFYHTLITQLLRGLEDNVANVRMVSANALSRVVENAEPSIIASRIRPALERRMAEENDHDCQNACRRALLKI
jgi:serine/threonine-protein phosphatase 2A regulatory subunit A